MPVQPSGALFLLWPLALLGLAVILTELVRRPLRRRLDSSMPLSLLLLVHNQGEALEGFLRTLLDLRSRTADRVSSRLVVVDVGSTDDTPRILHRLAREFPGLHLMQVDTRAERAVSNAVLDRALTSCQTPAVILLDLRDRTPLHHVLAGLERSLGMAALGGVKPWSSGVV